MASYEQYLQRQENINSIVSCLRLLGDMTRRELCDRLKLSWGCVSELSSLLIHSEVLLEKKSNGGDRGRTPLLLTLNPKKRVLGTDINTIGISCCLCDMYGKVIKEQRFDTDFSDKSGLLKSTTGAILETLGSDLAECVGIGIAMQGICRDGHLWNFPTEGESFVVATSELEGLFQIPTVVEHDPNCILLGVTDKNENETTVMVRLDNSIGMAVYANNGFLKPGDMELAHIVVKENGRKCSCGHYGCLQTVSSISGITEASGQPFDKLAASAQTDRAAKRYFEDAGKYLGMALGNFCNLISADRIMLCGEMAGYKSLFAESLKQAFESTALYPKRTRIVYSDITNAAYGAAKLSLINYFFKQSEEKPNVNAIS